MLASFDLLKSSMISMIMLLKTVKVSLEPSDSSCAVLHKTGWYIFY